MEQLEDSVDALLQPPDNMDADKVGTPSVELTEDGRLKFSELKGEKGDTGDKGDKGDPGYLLPVASGFFRMEVRADGHLWLVSPDMDESPMRVKRDETSPQYGHLILTI